ncbi:MAG: helix-hairpin-helix domain-containing protein [Balneola sp.]|nr:helix-hairpin-helix domain-containing protein [Balneola sp.]MBO6649897.1 helix-hairpin-helix domain-containing protein [Balneola sp.]MBO6711756.1 helix-hairpin-helix domain-containing protein [Balneola sp.]MBO6799950.1 helix-hairpin-helix domain-containing protein [Balneola sp.]MBO6871195.1 helix-hairpin-helix domain-containing protein [Balneola sp.]
MISVRKIAFLIFIGCAFTGSLIAQVKDSAKVQIEKQLEEALEEQETEEGELAGEQLAQFLEELAANPVNINSASVNDLLQIPGFNLKIARALISYRNENPFVNKGDILKVSGIGRATYTRMRPYITVGGASSRFRDLYTNPNYWLDGNSFEYITRYQQELNDQRGYEIPDSSGGYLGSQGKYYQRFRMSSRHLSINLTQEKDAGETLNGPTAFDYTSGHIALTENGKLKDLVIGDYALNFGQGLVLWTGAAFGKGREVVGTTGKNERGLRAYGSAQETDFFRGVAATYGEKIETTVFYSNRPRTAYVIEGDTTRFPSSSGFHRTLNEKERRNNIDQKTYGGRIRIDTPLGLFGATGYRTEFSSYIDRGNGLSNLYDFEGKENSVFGLDYRGLIGNVLAFVEIAQSRNGGTGGIAGIESPIGFKTDFTMAYRNYERHFQSFMGDGFGESSSDPRNEEGFYIGIRHGLNDKIALSGYVDQYRFDAPRSGIDQSSQGFDVLGLMEVDFNSNLNGYVLIRSETKDDTFSEINDRGVEEEFIGEQRRSSVRTQIEYQLSRSIRLRSRIELVESQGANEDKEYGMLLYQDIRVQASGKLQIDARVTVFDTDSFDSRVFQFENDLLYVLSNTALSGQGQRAYFVLNYEPTDFLEIWFKYSLSVFENVNFISSGLNEIEGNKNSDFGIQARVKF